MLRSPARRTTSESLRDERLDSLTQRTGRVGRARSQLLGPALLTVGKEVLDLPGGGGGRELLAPDVRRALRVTSKV